MIRGIHHIAIIVSDYEKSKYFYTEVLGLKVISENFRSSRNSWKLDLSLNGIYTIELFSFPDPPQRLSDPEATGLRHLAFSVDDLDQEIARLQEHGIPTEKIRTDEYTGKRFTFFMDPDGLPVEMCEM